MGLCYTCIRFTAIHIRLVCFTPVTVSRGCVMPGICQVCLCFTRIWLLWRLFQVVSLEHSRLSVSHQYDCVCFVLFCFARLVLVRVCFGRKCLFCFRITEISSVQFSPFTDSVAGGTWGTIQQRSSSGLFCRRPVWAVLAWAGMSASWCCSSSIPSADHGVAHLQGVLKDGLGEAVVACDVPQLCFLVVARRGSCGPTRELTLLRIQSLVLG